MLLKSFLMHAKVAPEPHHHWIRRQHRRHRCHQSRGDRHHCSCTDHQSQQRPMDNKLSSILYNCNCALAMLSAYFVAGGPWVAVSAAFWADFSAAFSAFSIVFCAATCRRVLFAGRGLHQSTISSATAQLHLEGNRTDFCKNYLNRGPLKLCTRENAQGWLPRRVESWLCPSILDCGADVRARCTFTFDKWTTGVLQAS